MGKKGKMSGFGEHPGKWQKHAYLSDLSQAIGYARQSAYDAPAIEKKRREEELLKRKKRSYGHLRFLVEDRMSDDQREQRADDLLPRRLLQSLVPTKDKAAVETRERAYEESKIMIGECLYRDLLSEGDQVLNNQRRKRERVPSLSLMCLETVAKRLNDYDDDDIQMVLSALAPDVAERLICLASKLNTLTDLNIKKLLHPRLESLTLGEHITDAGLLDFVTAFSSRMKSFGQQIDSWEEADWTEMDLSGLQSSSVGRLCLVSSKVSMLGLSSAPELVGQVAELILHDIDLYRTTTVPGRSGGGVVTLNEDALSDIAEVFPNLTDLYFSYCSWLTFQVLENWITVIGHARNSIDATRGCSSLTKTHTQPNAVAGTSNASISPGFTTTVDTGMLTDDDFPPPPPPNNMTIAPAVISKKSPCYLPCLRRLSVRGLRVARTAAAASPTELFEALRKLEDKYSAYDIFLDVSILNLK